MGRLFDAVAAITGVCPTASFDGQAAIALESAADKGERGHWFGRELLDTSGCPFRIRVEPLLLEVSRETARGASPATVSAKFHNTLVRACAHLTLSLCDEHALKTVCLSGGSFQNLLLKERLSARLHAAGLRVLANRLVPCNDGGVALGQVLVGSRTAQPVKPV